MNLKYIKDVLIYIYLIDYATSQTNCKQKTSMLQSGGQFVKWVLKENLFGD